MDERNGEPLGTRLRVLLSLAVVAVIVLLPLLTTSHPAGAQNGTPTAKPSSATKEATTAPTEAATAAPTEAPTQAPTATPAPFDPATASHQQVIAQGLAIFDVTPAIWRVTEIAVPRAGDAESISGDVSFTLQMEGLCVIRNDVTSKRALLTPGQAYFMSAEDPYTRRAGGSGASRAWIIEYLPADAKDEDAGGTVLYKTDPINAFPTGARDLELIANTLFPGESSPMPKHQGDAVLLVTSGSVVASAGGGASTLNTGNGLLLAGDAKITNNGDNVATYVVIAIGGKVNTPGVDASEPTATAEATTASEATAAPETTATAEATTAPDVTATPSNDPDKDGLTNDQEAQLGTDPNKADSDGDGLDDGREVNSTGTDPLNPDTDGDGATDGNEELISGTDPNDPNSKP